MIIETLNKVYFLGIGGIGMSALAKFFVSKGIEVHGYDRARTPLTGELEREGVHIHYEENSALIPDNLDLIVYTPAIPNTNMEWNKLKSMGVRIVKRAELLGELVSSMNLIAVAGTHGKTTISTMIAFMLNSSSIKCNAFLGGVSANFSSNLVLSPTSDLMVVEADEFDRSFLQLHPNIAVVSSMDADHLDIYGTKEEMEISFQQFVHQAKVGGSVFMKYGLNLTSAQSVYTYALNNEDADFYAENVRVKNGVFMFDFLSKDGKMIKDLTLATPGLHNVENAVVAIAVALHCGAMEQEIRMAASNFLGVKRRFETKIKKEKFVYIDDYAHHPAELDACIASARIMYPGKKITGVFQPHLYSRTRDFANEFARSLSKLDELFLLDIYPARELPIAGITSEMLLGKVTIKQKYLCNKQNLIPLLQESNPEILITMGAGDIDQCVVKIVEAFA